MILGCIADDFTGATDLANTLTRRGMHTVQMIGVPQGVAPTADAIVVALKSRTIPAADAVSQSLAALSWLEQNGARQIYFKYCSTFDSTDAGNIGPVADALLDELGENFTVVCPAFPENGRTIFMGHLFVGEVLLSDSSMRNHPLTPMHDSNLVNVLGRQTRHKTGLVPHHVVKQGSGAISEAFGKLQGAGIRHAVIDAIDDADLISLAEACKDLVLVTGGSGAAIGLPENYRRLGLLPARVVANALRPVGGSGVVLSGSCSTATLAQVDAMKKTSPSFMLQPPELARDFAAHVTEALAFAAANLRTLPVLIYASVDATQVAAIQAKLGREQSGTLVERAIAAIAKELAASGVRRFVVAGGETSGAVVSALGIDALEIGPQIVPGVPATLSTGEISYALALKSGNFGGPAFFAEALAALP
jgi:3-dehydrotetronate 4-kinase